jgi:hypothetical protein
MPAKKENNGCGCASIPFSLIIVLFGLGYWGFTNLDKVEIGKFLPNNQQPTPENLTPAPTKQTPVVNSPVEQVIPTPTATNKPQITPLPVTPKQSPSTQTAWEKKEIRGIYLSRYQATNNADEKTIRERVRYYRSQGIIQLFMEYGEMVARCIKAM